MTSLQVAMERFAAVYHARPALVAEQRGWSPVLCLVASDTGEAVTVRVADGRIVAVVDGRTSCDVEITSDAATLVDILELRRGPNEPYVFGELTVRGSEADFFRLDYITSVLCPE